MQADGAQKRECVCVLRQKFASDISLNETVFVLVSGALMHRWGRAVMLPGASAAAAILMLSALANCSFESLWTTVRVEMPQNRKAFKFKSHLKTQAEKENSRQFAR